MVYSISMKQISPVSRQDFLLNKRGPDDINLSTLTSVSLPACRGHLLYKEAV